MNSGSWWQRRRDRRRAELRKRTLVNQLTAAIGSESPERVAEIEAELADILKAYPPGDYYNPLGI